MSRSRAIAKLGDPYKSHKRGRVSFVLSPQALAALDHLAATGLHGRGRSGVARELLLRALRDELRAVQGRRA